MSLFLPKSPGYPWLSVARTCACCQRAIPCCQQCRKPSRGAPQGLSRAAGWSRPSLFWSLVPQNIVVPLSLTTRRCVVYPRTQKMLVGSRSFPSLPTTAGKSSELGEILTLDEVAEYLKIPRKTVYNMTRSGELPAFKAGKHWRVPRAELGAWIARKLPANGGESA